METRCRECHGQYDQIFDATEYIEDKSKEFFEIARTNHDFWYGQTCERIGEELKKVLSILSPKEKDSE